MSLSKSKMAEESTSTVAMSDSKEILIDFGDICRYCLNETDSTISINDKYVTQGKNEEHTIYDFVTKLSNIEAESPNGFPTLVCNNCWEMIQVCHEFKESCRQSDTSLRECYSRTLEQTKAQFFQEEIEIKMEEIEIDQEPDEKLLKNNNTLTNRLIDAQIKLKEDIKRNQFIMAKENKLEGHTCRTCHTNFSSEEDLKTHTEAKHSKIITKCKFCPEMFLEGPNLINHYKNVHKKYPEGTEGDKKFYCLSCNPARSFTKRDSVSRHLKIAHGKSVEDIKNELGEESGKKYECTRCSVSFVSRSNVIRHLIRQHKLGKGDIKEEDFKIQEEEKEEEKIKLSKVYVCTDCFPPNTFDEMVEFISHKERTHDKDLENIPVKELSAVYVPSINVFDKDETKAKIICKNCYPPVTFSSTRDFVTHLNGYHESAETEIVETGEADFEPKEKWDCADCSASFSRKFNLRRHYKRKHGKTVKVGFTPCPDCDEVFLTNRQAVQHGITAHGKYYADLHDQYKRKILLEGEKPERDKKFECDFCKKKYQLKDALRKHVKNEHLTDKREENVICPYCGKTLTKKENLKSHIEYVHEAVFVSCPICQKEVNFRALGKHYKIHQNEKIPSVKSAKFLCNLCGKILMSKRSYADHQKLHDNIRDHICDVCGEGFTNRRCLYMHKRTHESSLRKSFKCDKCEKAFNGRQSLHRHLLTHSGTKDFVCEMCSKTFYTIQELKRHLRYHKKEYRFNCQLCEMKFFDKSRYRNHLMRHRNIRPHKCHFCDKVFIVRRKMHLHMAAKHNYQVSDTKGIWKDPKTYVPLDDLL